MLNFLPSTLIFVTWAISLSLACLPFLLAQNEILGWRMAAIIVIPVIFSVTFVTVAGLLSLRSQRRITRGRFPREPFHPIYFHRRIYGNCWTAVFYFKPLYAAFVSIPVLKKYMFWLFGYRGSHQFVVYPDTWIRDLPLLEFGKGSYVSNRATLGTNMCLNDGTILVDRIRLGEKTLVGHMSLLAPGVRTGRAVEVGVGSAVGIRCHLKDGAKVGVACAVNHGALIGKNTQIGSHSFIGLRAEIGDDLKLPPASNIPSGAVVRTAEDVESYFSSENQKLRAKVMEVGEILQHGLETIF